MTTSSPAESDASNLQLETIEDRSASAGSSSDEEEVIRPAVKNVCKAESEADVISPVESGERMMAKKGANIWVRGSGLRSTLPLVPVHWSSACYKAHQDRHHLLLV
jgi:hypothetical protein